MFSFGALIAGGQITNVSSVFNPDKLAHLGPLVDFEALQREWKTGAL